MGLKMGAGMGMGMNNIAIPNRWDPRPYQLPAWRALEGGVKRAALIWHRRAGKDSFGLNWTACAAHDAVGTYWHMLPTIRQARRVIWDRLDRESGEKSLDLVFPPRLRRARNETEMKIELKNGSIWQLCGSDNYDHLVGADPLGVVFSEYSLADPAAWDYIRPILAENGGWAMFIYTPRGRNHGYRMLRLAEQNPDWFTQVLTVDDTKRKNGSPVINKSAIDEDLRSGMAEDIVKQEYWCSFDAAFHGAYYGAQMEKARTAGRILSMHADPQQPVETWWDLGVADSTSIWFVQYAGHEVHVIDYEEASGEGLAYSARLIQNKPYVYSRHIAPHDIRARESGTGKSREEVARSLGLRFEIAPKLSIADGIDAVRAILPRCHFNSDVCERGIDALTLYRKEFNEKTKTFKDHPLHDWTSHAADAFRYGATARKKGAGAGQVHQADTGFSVL